jgi:hypothetical protein
MRHPHEHTRPLPSRPPLHAPRSGHGLLLALALLLAWPVTGNGSDDSLQTEYRVKTAFLYNFARFVTWPEIPHEQFTLCVLGSNLLGEHTHTLLDKTVHDRQLRVLHLNGPSMLDQCQVVFIGEAYTQRLHEVMPALRGLPVLTVSDIEGFVARGGMIGFRLIDNRVRFEINTVAANNAGLSISSKLLTLASSIRSEDR